ncbi:MAG: universal stress protein [Bacteroidota bacterium]
MKKILVPTDYSPLSINALDFAIDIAQTAGAEIHLVHFLNAPIEAVTFNELMQENTDSRQDFYSDLDLDTHRSRLKEIIRSKADRGTNISSAIGGSGVILGSDKYVDAFAIDLLVLGADDVEEEKGEFPISYSQELTQNLKIPVISLTDHVDYVDMTKLVLGVDPNKHKDLEGLGKMIGPVINSMDAEVYLVDVIKTGETDDQQLANKLHTFARAAQLKNYKVVVIKHPDDLDGLLKYADKVDAGLVALVSDGKPNIFRFFKDSFATTVVKATDMPVLVFNSNGY